MFIFKTIYKYVTEQYEKNIYKSSHRRCSIKKSVLKKFHKIHRKTSVSESLLQKRLQHKCFSVDFAKFLRAPIL